MKEERFDCIVDNQITLCKDILNNKAGEYARITDRLHNFNKAGTIQNCSPRQALAGMMIKHTVSVYDLCRDEDLASKKIWDEKITDSINYLFLLQALVHEERDKIDCYDEPEGIHAKFIHCICCQWMDQCASYSMNEDDGCYEESCYIGWPRNNIFVFRDPRSRSDFFNKCTEILDKYDSLSCANARNIYGASNDAFEDQLWRIGWRTPLKPIYYNNFDSYCIQFPMPKKLSLKED